MADLPFAEVRMQVTGGRVPFDSAPGLHQWMKDRNEDEQWDLSPAIAVLFEDATQEALGQVWVAVYETSVKPYVVAPAIAEQLHKVSREHGAGRTIAITLFNEAWAYPVPTDLVGEDGLVPENYQAVAQDRIEQKVVMTIDLARIQVNAMSSRGRGEPWRDGDEMDNQLGNASEALQRAAEACVNLDLETPNKEER